jgi:hypothetical protein
MDCISNVVCCFSVVKVVLPLFILITVKKY